MNDGPIILLAAINAKYIHSNLAIHSLAASAGDYREHVVPMEFTINMTKDQILEEIYKQHPDVLCFSCYIWNISYVENIARSFQKLCPEVSIWVGGPEVSYEVKSFLEEHPYIYGAMIGEGEDTFRELCGYYCEGGRLDEIAGLAYRQEDGCIRFTAPREILDLSSLPFCYDRLEDYSNRIIYYESSRGCPFSCSYCLSSVDKKLRFRKIELVKRELQFFLDQKVPQIKFVDRTFNCNHEHCLAIWEFIKERDNGITNFHFEISADLLTEEELSLLCGMRPGLVQLEIGVQTTNQETIAEIHRRMKLDQVKENVARIRKAGNIHQHLDLIAGLPYEGYQRFRESFDEIYALGAEALQLGFLKVLKGSYMYEHAKEYGILYHDEPPYEVLSTKWLTYEEILRIKLAEEQLEIYYNSGQYEVTMEILACIISSPFDFFVGMGEYCDRQGLRLMNHSRLRRCEILLAYLRTWEFMEQIRREYVADAQNEREGLTELIQECLTYDLYARENCKTRPFWAPDMKSYRDLTHRFCTKGKLSHLEPFHYHFPQKTEFGLRMRLPQRLDSPVWICFDYENKSVREISTCNNDGGKV